MAEQDNYYSSDRRRAVGFVTFKPSALALQAMAVSAESDRNLPIGVPFQNNDAVSTADAVCDFRSVAFVVH